MGAWPGRLAVTGWTLTLPERPVLARSTLRQSRLPLSRPGRLVLHKTGKWEARGGGSR